MSNTRPALFPAFLKLAGKKCLIVGGGPVAESKLASFQQAGARVTVVSPTLTQGLADAVTNQVICWEARRFEPCDLLGMFLVVAATRDDQVNQFIFREADRRNILCNCVDEPDRCHFYYPAVVQRGALQIAISTNGLSPSLAQRLRRELELQFGPEYEQWVEWLGRVRGALMRTGSSFETRRRVLAKLASHAIFHRWEAAQRRKALQKGASL